MLHYRIRICISGHSNFDKDWNLFLQKWFYIKLLIIVFIRMCDAPCWKSNNICNTWKIKEKLKILMSCNDLFFINTTKKTLKPSKQNETFQFPGWMRKNFIARNISWRVSAETWDASCFKKGLLEKNNSVPNSCEILPLKKILFQDLTDAFFKYLFMYVKLVIPNTLYTDIMQF